MQNLLNLLPQGFDVIAQGQCRYRLLQFQRRKVQLAFTLNFDLEIGKIQLFDDVVRNAETLETQFGTRQRNKAHITQQTDEVFPVKTFVKIEFAPLLRGDFPLTDQRFQHGVIGITVADGKQAHDSTVIRSNVFIQHVFREGAGCVIHIIQKVQHHIRVIHGLAVSSEDIPVVPVFQRRQQGIRSNRALFGQWADQGIGFCLCQADDFVELRQQGKVFGDIETGGEAVQHQRGYAGNDQPVDRTLLGRGFDAFVKRPHETTFAHDSTEIIQIIRQQRVGEMVVFVNDQVNFLVAHQTQQIRQFICRRRGVHLIQTIQTRCRILILVQKGRNSQRNFVVEC